MAKSSSKAELLQGTLDMLILKSLVGGPRHGYSIAQWIAAITDKALEVEEGSLYPALHRMERREWIASSWGQSDSNRRAKFYQLTRTGKSQLNQEVHMWSRLVSAIELVLDADPAEGAR
jgi:transcriptional regulator